MLPIVSISATPPFLVRLIAFAYDKLIQQPVAGIAHLVVGAVQTVGPLLRATVHAAIGTVRSYLSSSDEVAVEQGIDRMMVGTALLAWPLAVLGTVLLWQAPFLVQAMLAVGTLGLVNELRHGFDLADSPVRERRSSCLTPSCLPFRCWHAASPSWPCVTPTGWCMCCAKAAKSAARCCSIAWSS